MKKSVKIVLSADDLQNVFNLIHGVYAPLKGFLKQEDYNCVLQNMRLINNEIWSIPIILHISDKQRQEILRKKTKQILLTNKRKKIIAKLLNYEIYSIDKKKHCQLLYGTTNKKHPGVNEIFHKSEFLIGGKVKLVADFNFKFCDFFYSPYQAKKLFRSMGWKKVVAFQTRNVPHRGHEFLQKAALNQVDGIFIQPVIGSKKIQDFKDEYIIASYQTLINKYFPPRTACLGILPVKMHYAGPKEALFHALIRKNFGCTHFIVGRDHAGVGNFYDPFAAHKIFDQFESKELGIKILKYPEVVYDSKNHVHTFEYKTKALKTIKFSGSVLRSHVKDKIKPPGYLIRPEIYDILVNSRNSLVDEMYRQHNQNKEKSGCVIWFTGFSQSGKSTLADKVYEYLIKQNITSERLDGDVVRESLTKDLGFSKKDRNENIRRVGFLARMLSKNGIFVVASFISPYKKAREQLKKQIPNFIEIFVNTPLKICEKRDTKGLYKKARAGVIKNFTGISHPYEKPKHPDITIDTVNQNVDDNIRIIIKYLRKNNYI